MNEDKLLSEAKKYLKRKCFESTVSMEIIENNVVNGEGELIVNCTVRFLGVFKSSWKKVFRFIDDKIVSMQAEKR
jgi:hypothetical protein